MAISKYVGRYNLQQPEKMAENGFYPEPELECKFYAVY